MSCGAQARASSLDRSGVRLLLFSLCTRTSHLGHLTALHHSDLTISGPSTQFRTCSLVYSTYRSVLSVPAAFVSHFTRSGRSLHAFTRVCVAIHNCPSLSVSSAFLPSSCLSGCPCVRRAQRVKREKLFQATSICFQTEQRQVPASQPSNCDFISAPFTDR